MQRRYLFLTAILVALACVLALTPPMAGWTGTQEPQKPPEQEKAAEKGKKDENDKEKEKKKDKEKSFEEVVEEMEKIEGLFTFYRKADEDKVLIELLPEQLDRDYILSPKQESGTGERGLWGTTMMWQGESIVQWHRLGKHVQFVQQNIRFRAQAGSPAARALENSFSDSVLATAKILSKPHPERNSVLIDLRDILLAGDLHGLGSYFKEVYKGGYKFDKKNSGFVLVKSFPRNSEIGTVAHFVAEEIKQSSVTIPDPRSISVRFRYSLVALPENDYRPRLADDRVGYFLNQHMDFSNLAPDTPYVRYLRRWNLNKKNPRAAVSEPVEPIVFWLENSIPEEYRDAMREGILLWNRAFEKAGFKNAMVVKQQPDDADWDPADIRYNTIRWLVGYGASFAVGPSHTNPYTGQIIDADISFSDGILRLGARRRYQLWVDPVQRIEQLLQEPEPSHFGQHGAPSVCTYADGLVELASAAYDILAARPGWSSEKEKEFVRQYVAEVTAHEVGHTLGLRHNFRASIINRVDQLADTKRTHKVGLAASVMDYNPPIVALKGEKQGDYLPRVVGSYDEWVIEYGYKPIPGTPTAEDELPELRKIAARVADPLLPYGTDFDAGLGPRSLDPRNTRFDFSSEPLDWFAHEFKLVKELWANMESKLLKEGESYAILRRAFGYSWRPYTRSSLVAAKHIGGIYHNRDHYGDPNGRPPYVPVPAAEQRAALAFLANQIWAPEVFQAPADLLNKLQFERFLDFQSSVYSAQRLDYPLHNIVLAVQSSSLNSLYHPIKMSRLQDLELKYPDPNDRFTLADMFVGVRKAIWAELDSGAAINSFRRNLQRAHLKHLMRLVLKPEKGTPEDGVTLARADLTNLAGRIDRALGGDGLDYTTRAHLEETQARIRQTLEAQMQRVL